MSNNPLAEVFGFGCGDSSPKAQRYRSQRLCPFNNHVPNCTKDKANAPLGVCSIIHDDAPTITCPVRFKEEWIVAETASRFFFGDNANWTSLPEVRLKDSSGKSAGNIDLVIVQYDEQGKMIDYGALEIQAVYISGNVREPFEHYMQLSIDGQKTFSWKGHAKYPRADFLSSSRKRLVPQLLFKGKILQSWGRKCAVALDEPFFNTLPDLTIVDEEHAEIAWMIFCLEPNDSSGFTLKLERTVYTKFNDSLLQISTPKIGSESSFIETLQSKINKKLGGAPPVAPLLGNEEEN
jgi:hypothetical protein